MIAPKIYHESEMDIVAYHEDRDYISSSGLKQFMISPAHLQMMYDKPQERKSYFDFGHIFELMLLQPETKDENVYIIDDVSITCI